VLLKVVMIAGVALVALPSLWLGIRGAGRRSGYSSADPGDRASIVVIVVLRALILLLVLALSAVVLISAIGAIIKDVVMPDLVLVFFVLDLLLAMLVLLTFGRRDPRPTRRRASPARR
jgi:protein-S-isoprenylcysteine O-methyltransferase Ste14